MKLLYLDPASIPGEGTTEIIQFRLIKPLADHLTAAMVEAGFKNDRRKFFTWLLTELFAHKLSAIVPVTGSSNSPSIRNLVNENQGLKERLDGLMKYGVKREDYDSILTERDNLQRQIQSLQSENERLINSAHEHASSSQLYTPAQNTPDSANIENTAVTGLLQGVTAVNTEGVSGSVTPHVTPGVTGGVTPSVTAANDSGVTENTVYVTDVDESELHPFLRTTGYQPPKVKSLQEILASQSPAAEFIRPVNQEELISLHGNASPVTAKRLTTAGSDNNQELINNLLEEIERLNTQVPEIPDGVFTLTPEEMQGIEAVLREHAELGKAFGELANSESALRIVNQKIKSAIGKTLEKIHSDLLQFTNMKFELQSFIEIYQYYLENEFEQ